MKTGHILLIAACYLIGLLSCTEEQASQKTLEEFRTDSMAKAGATSVPSPDTTGFVGQWKSTYSEYAYKFTLGLQIIKTETGACPGYSCTWTRKDQFGGQRETYNWCAKYENSILSGTGNLWRDNSAIRLYKDGAIITAVVEAPGQSLPWEFSFTRQ